MRWKKNLLIGFLAATVSGGFLFQYIAHRRNLKEALLPLGLNLQADHFKITKHSKKVMRKREVAEIRAESDAAQIKILRIPAKNFEDAVNYLERRVVTIQSVFSPRQEAYPGAISHRTECPEKFLPKIDEFHGNGFQGVDIEAAATERKRLGACTESELIYNVRVVLLYCQAQENIFEIEIYSLREETTELPPRSLFSCRS